MSARFCLPRTIRYITITRKSTPALSFQNTHSTSDSKYDTSVIADCESMHALGKACMKEDIQRSYLGFPPMLHKKKLAWNEAKVHKGAACSCDHKIRLKSIMNYE